MSLIQKESKEKEYIPVSEDFCMGSLRSITISGINPQEYNYLYEINGKIIVALSMAFVMAFLIIIPKILCIVPKKKRNKKRDKGTVMLSPDSKAN